MNLADISTKYTTEDRCRELLRRLRWPNGVLCPRCTQSAVDLETDKDLFYCKSCDYQFTVTACTIFNDSHLPLTKWFMATLLLCEAKKGISACQVQRTIGVSYKTVWYLCHRIRAAMKEADKPLLDGTVEMDEMFIGGVEHGKNIGRSGNKKIVVAIRKRNGDLRFFHVPNTQAKTLAKYIKQNISVDADYVMTDDSPSYPKAMIRAGIHGSKHQTVTHSHKVYVAGDAHVNTVENAFSLFKRGIVGTWHHLSGKHLAAYLEEMEFRFNRRKDKNLFLDTLQHMITTPTLTFEKLTA
jgi:transposase-like protein